ncbi:MAG: hypothetical protein JRN06_12465 [Nitrososphaerota archaeon]|nr:hypothetical protein [Nitrososphaerota archaeon]
MRRKKRSSRRAALYVATIIGVAVLVAAGWSYSRGGDQKPVILYVNQGNGRVGESNFGQMLSFATAHGFNTVFFQVYRQGNLLFNGSELSFFVTSAHSDQLKIFFALYITNSSQPIPPAIFGLGEDGVSLDMSALSLPAQESLLGDLGSCRCQTAVTTTDMLSPLRPDLLILETYFPSQQQYIKTGVIGSVGAFAVSNRPEYQQEFQYALGNSDGVMVFDYAGLLKSGY